MRRDAGRRGASAAGPCRLPHTIVRWTGAGRAGRPPARLQRRQPGARVVDDAVERGRVRVRGREAGQRVLAAQPHARRRRRLPDLPRRTAGSGTAQASLRARPRPAEARAGLPGARRMPATPKGASQAPPLSTVAERHSPTQGAPATAAGLCCTRDCSHGRPAVACTLAAHSSAANRDAAPPSSVQRREAERRGVPGCGRRAWRSRPSGPQSACGGCCASHISTHVSVSAAPCRAHISTAAL